MSPILGLPDDEMDCVIGHISRDLSSGHAALLRMALTPRKRLAIFIWLISFNQALSSKATKDVRCARGSP